MGGDWRIRKEFKVIIRYLASVRLFWIIEKDCQKKKKVREGGVCRCRVKERRMGGDRNREEVPRHCRIQLGWFIVAVGG